MEHWCNDTDENTEVLAEKPVLFSENPTWNGLWLNHSLCSGKPATNQVNFCYCYSVVLGLQWLPIDVMTKQILRKMVEFYFMCLRGPDSVVGISSILSKITHINKTCRTIPVSVHKWRDNGKVLRYTSAKTCVNHCQKFVRFEAQNVRISDVAVSKR